MNTKNNQRYRNMDIYMKAALLELMQETDFKKITVKQICQRAGVNRGTFYTHYSDIYAMLQDAENYLSDDLIQTVKDFLSCNKKSGKSLLELYIHYIKEHRYFYRVSLSNRKRLPLRDTFKPLWTELALPEFHRAGITDEEELSYYAIAFEGSITMVLQHWLETDCAADEKKIAVILQHCAFAS